MMSDEILKTIADLEDKFDRLYRSGQHTEAMETAVEGSMKIAHLAGEHSLEFARASRPLAFMYSQLGEYAKAKSLDKKILTIQRDILGEDHLEVANSINNLGVLYFQVGNYKKAESFFQKAFDIRKGKLPKNHEYIATSLNNLASLYQIQGEYAKAELLYLEALQIHCRNCGVADIGSDISLAKGIADVVLDKLTMSGLIPGEEVSNSQVIQFDEALKNLAQLYRDTGDYTKAELLFQEVLNIQFNIFGLNHIEFAQTLNNCALLFLDMGKHAQAELNFRKALDIQRKNLGENSPQCANSLDSLGALYHSIGDMTLALQHYQKAMGIRRVSLGENSSEYADSLDSVGRVYREMGRFVDAERSYQQSLDIRRSRFGDNNNYVAKSYNNLGMLYRAMSEYGNAEPMYRKALDIIRQQFGENHPAHLFVMNNIAFLYYAMGRYGDAEALYRNVLDGRRMVLGKNHPDVAQSSINLAVVCAATGRHREALAIIDETRAIYDVKMREVFSFGSDVTRLNHLEYIRGFTYVYLSLVLQYFPESQKAICGALELILKRKALGADVLATQRDVVLSGKYPGLEIKLREINALRMQIGQMISAGPGQGEDAVTHEKHIDALGVKKEQLEVELARMIPEIELEHKLRNANVETIAETLSEGTALIEFVRINMFDFKAANAGGWQISSEDRYVAFLLPAGEPENVRMFDLGKAELIDKRITSYLKLIKGTEDGDIMSEGAILRAQLFDPLKDVMGNLKKLFISPDGELSRLPFEVLATTDGRFLIDDFMITYLCSGRDLLRIGILLDGSPSEPFIAADPDFDFSDAYMKRTQPSMLENQQLRELDNAIEDFKPLPDTREEGEFVAQKLGVKPWLGREVLEARLKRCRSPSIIHIATHGFFSPDQPDDSGGDNPSLGTRYRDTRNIIISIPERKLENTLLRSGLALTGANTWRRRGRLPEDAEDGILTALDVTGLDLSNTELVVLSACETGLGEVYTGEGVLGLRRSFVVAGAQTLVISLWKVPSEKTRELMMDYYCRLLDGQGRAEALRHAQLALKSKSEEYSDPFYWGAFICQGDPGPLKSMTQKA